VKHGSKIECHGCLAAKTTKTAKQHSKGESSSAKLLKGNLWCVDDNKMSKQSINGNKYYLTFVEWQTTFVKHFFRKSNEERHWSKSIEDFFRWLKESAGLHKDFQEIKQLQSDAGTIFTSQRC
jgi:hypothetical protein